MIDLKFVFSDPIEIGQTTELVFSNYIPYVNTIPTHRIIDTGRLNTSSKVDNMPEERVCKCAMRCMLTLARQLKNFKEENCIYNYADPRKVPDLEVKNVQLN